MISLISINLVTLDRCFEKMKPMASRIKIPRRERSRCGDVYVSSTINMTNIANTMMIEIYLKYLGKEIIYFLDSMQRTVTLLVDLNHVRS